MARLSGWMVFFVGAATLGVATAWFVTSEPEAAESGGRPPYVLPVVLGEVRRGDVEPVVHLTGNVRSSRDAVLAFTTRGVVAEWTVTEGDRVRQGQELGHLIDTEQRLALAASEADLAFSERELEKLEAGARKEEKARLAAELDAARAEAVVAEQDAKRTRTLTEDRILSVSDQDRQEARLRAALARVDAAAARFAESEAGNRPEDIAIARARVAAAKAAVDRARHERDKTRLVAPFDGVVSRRLQSSGDYVEVGEGVLAVVDTGALEIDVEIPSGLAARIGAGASTGVGTEVRLSLDEHPSFERRATLAALIPVAEDESRNFRGIVRLVGSEAAPGDEVLRAGHFVRVEMALDRVAGATIVPADAVRTVDSGSVVVAARGEPLAAEWVPVRVLASDANGAAVEPLGEAVLAPGEKIVVVGVDLAFPGAPLLPRELDAGTGSAR